MSTEPKREGLQGFLLVPILFGPMIYFVVFEGSEPILVQKFSD